MRRSTALLLLAGLAACAGPGAGLTRFEREQLERRERGLAMSTQRVHDPAVLGRLVHWVGRIEPGATLRLYVIEHPAPQAELIGNEVLLVRTGLLAAVRSDDELAFVLAHELAHRALGHVAARRTPGWDARGAERAADRWAAARLQALGLDPAAGRTVLARLLPGLPPPAQPPVRDRLDALEDGTPR